jgi:uncharacterized protein YndB with AHSA1/START domain
MNHTLESTGTVVVNVSPTRMWDVATNPAIIKEYLFGTETVTDWKIGSEIAFRGEYQGHTYRDHGIIKEFIPEHKLAYTYWSGFSGLADEPENYSLVTLEINTISSTSCSFSWTMKGFVDETRQQHSQSGMNPFLEQIKAISER